MFVSYMVIVDPQPTNHTHSRLEFLNIKSQTKPEARHHVGRNIIYLRNKLKKRVQKYKNNYILLLKGESKNY